MTRARCAPLCVVAFLLSPPAVERTAAQTPSSGTSSPPHRPARVVPWRGRAATPQGADTLDVHTILRERSSMLDSLLGAEVTSFDTTGVDSLVSALDRGGAAAVRAFKPKALKSRTFSYGVRPLTLTTYNRVDGFLLGSGIGTEVHGLVSVDGDAGYAFSRKRWAGRVHASIPPPTRLFKVEGGWSDRVEPFGPNQGDYFTSFAALTAGQDRQDYLHRWGWEAGVRIDPSRRTSIGIRYTTYEDDTAVAVQDYNVFNNEAASIEDPNPAVDAGTVRAILLDTDWRSRHERTKAHFEAGVAGGGLGGDFEYAWQSLRLSRTQAAWQGSILRLTLAGMNTAGGPPVQAVAYVGGDGNLRGFERLEYSGSRSVALRSEFAYGRDLLAMSKIPGVRSLHLQFIPFVDVASTWGDAAGVAGSEPLDGAWKSGVGLGVRRNFYYPVFGGIQFDFSWRTDGGPSGVDVWFRVLPFE